MLMEEDREVDEGEMGIKELKGEKKGRKPIAEPNNDHERTPFAQSRLGVTLSKCKTWNRFQIDFHCPLLIDPSKDSIPYISREGSIPMAAGGQRHKRQDRG